MKVKPKERNNKKNNNKAKETANAETLRQHE
jgi:hypothetical protein